MRVIVFLVACWLFCSCGMSRKQVLALETSYKTEIGTLTEQLQKSRSENTRLQLDLAERKGENGALLATQDKFLKRLSELEEQLDQANNQAQSNASNLGETLKERNAKIRSLEKQIETVKSLMAKRQEEYAKLIQVFKDSLATYPATQYSVELRNSQIVVAFTDALLFKPGVVNKVEPAGSAALNTVSKILNSRPEWLVQITGHSDNQAASRRNQDPWDFTALRAATVVRLLTDTYDLSANRVTLASKADVDPAASNETIEGQARNRRIAINLYLAEEEFWKNVGKVLSE
jgi:chemotaxis protein MotB